MLYAVLGSLLNSDWNSLNEKRINKQILERGKRMTLTGIYRNNILDKGQTSPDWDSPMKATTKGHGFTGFIHVLIQLLCSVGNLKQKSNYIFFVLLCLLLHLVPRAWTQIFLFIRQALYSPAHWEAQYIILCFSNKESSKHQVHTFGHSMQKAEARR